MDHLFVDADAVPTLVKVNRAADTRIRREVVGQMLDYAVELAHYRGGGDLRVLVPRIHGEVAIGAESPAARRAAQRTTRVDMDTVTRTRLTPDHRRIVTALLDHASAHGRLQGGTAEYPSVSVYYPASGRLVPGWTISLHESPAREEISFSFGSITHQLGVESPAAFAASLPATPLLAKGLDAQRERSYKGWLSVPSTDFADEPAAVDVILAAIRGLRADSGFAP
ncbi:hypothetical protein [Streptomyces sp. NPDC021224]|uniref:hypothetical protein n=1 Tax=unclassified Streptomyces TaxID=2593676 RepID=UPI00378C2352